MASHSSSRAGAGVAVPDQVVLSVSGHLTDRDRSLVRLVAEHRVLTTGQLTAMYFTSLTTARHRLAVLVRLGLLRRFRPRREVGSASGHYLLGPVGAALLGAEDRDERKWLPQVRADRQLALARSQRLAHMTGAGWFFVALTRHARTSGGKLTQWWGEQATAAWLKRTYVSGARLDVHPDGLGVWAQDGTDLAFVLEYDTGSEHLSQLTAKLDGYARPGGNDEYSKGPVSLPVLFCLRAPGREQSARRALAAHPAARVLPIATAAIDPEYTSPAGPVWLPLAGPPGRPMRLIELGAVMPGGRPGGSRSAQQQEPEGGELEDDPDDLYGP
jgi:hypothetical protein